MSRFKRGDAVCYSAEFIRRVGFQNAPEAHMQGRIHQIALGAHEQTVAVVQFGRTYEDVRTVNVRNLSPLTSNQWISA